MLDVNTVHMHNIYNFMLSLLMTRATLLRVTGTHPEEVAIECVVRSLPSGNDHHQFLRRGEGWRLAAGWPMCGMPQGCGQGDRDRLRPECSEQPIEQKRDSVSNQQENQDSRQNGIGHNEEELQEDELHGVDKPHRGKHTANVGMIGRRPAEQADCDVLGHS